MSPFVDSNVLLYLLSADAGKAGIAEVLLAGKVIVSVQVLNEFANVAHRKLGLAWPDVRAALADVMRFADVRPLTVETHKLGIDVAERYRFSIYDALIVAAAIEAGCATLASEDLQNGQRIDRRLSIMNPFA